MTDARLRAETVRRQQAEALLVRLLESGRYTASMQAHTREVAIAYLAALGVPVRRPGETASDAGAVLAREAVIAAARDSAKGR